MNPTLTALQQQVSCYQKLAKLAETQHTCVEQGRDDELVSILGLRQEVLDMLADLDEVIAPARRRWSDYLTELPPDDRGRAEEMMSETRLLLKKITAVDMDDSLILQQRKLNTTLQLNRINMAQRVNRTYAASAYARRPSSVDLQK